MSVTFTGGVNIAVKIPKSRYEQTVHFYRDILGLNVEEQQIDHPTIKRSHRLQFGNNVLWLDCIDNYTHSEVWLELRTENVGVAKDYLESQGVNTCDELEQVSGGMHWIMDPAGTVLLLCPDNEQ